VYHVLLLLALWSCGRGVSVVQGQRQIHRAHLGPSTPPLELCKPRPSATGARYRSGTTGRCRCAPRDHWYRTSDGPPHASSCATCFKLRHSRSTKTLSNQRSRPSMLVRTPAASSLSVNATLVNCAPWSVLKVSGRPFLGASSSASSQNEVSILFDRTPRQNVSAVPVHHRDQIEKAPGHRDVSNVGGPHLVRPLDRQAAQQVGIDPVLRRATAGLRLWGPGLRAPSAASAPAPPRLRLTWRPAWRSWAVIRREP
jgi:hypothetical protein